MRNYGYIKPVIKDEDYILGGLRSAPYEVLCEDGQWTEYLPSPEYQQRGGIETKSCTVFGTENVLEALFKRKFGISINWSDRYVAIMAGVGSEGADPQKIAETIRTQSGLIDETYLPFVDGMSYELFFSPKPMTSDYLNLGKKWLSQWVLKHEYCFTSGTLKEKQDKLKEGLKTSPLGVSVFAWVENDKELFYKPQGFPDNHWVMLFGYVENKYWLIYDSYDTLMKRLDWDYDFEIAKRYHLEKRPTTEELNILQKIINLLAQIIGLQAVFVAEIVKKNSENMVQPIEEKKSRIVDWAKAIEIYEKSPKDWNNPGSIRAKSGGYLKFKTYREGFDYLCDYLTRASTGKHKAYNPEMTLLRFFEIYAPKSDKNHPDIYASFVALKLGVEVSIKIKELL